MYIHMCYAVCSIEMVLIRSGPISTCMNMYVERLVRGRPAQRNMHINQDMYM
jgi:hypothetical protein